MVGHNMLLDVGHTVHQFVDELPDNLADFKELVQDTFPNLIDTKYMSTSHPFRELVQSTVLGELVKKVQAPPFQLPRGCIISYWH
jgi:poly(A)-specific ribonuclease